MNKNIEAIARGYLFFKVNNKFFIFYNSALSYKKSIELSSSVEFLGFHVYKHWRAFYIRCCFSHK
jgi:hypothetical protein